jgi:hypothetical protein
MTGGAQSGTQSGGTQSGGAGGANGTSSGGTGGAAACPAAALLGSLGEDHLLAGATMEDATAASAPFDARYVYISGGLFDGADPCASCATSCSSHGTSCANSAGGCAWWGCYQYDQNPPGEYVRDFVATAQQNHQIPLFTYYEILQASGASEGMGEVQAANDANFMARYFADFRFLLQQIGQNVAMIHHEPDFWGYCEQANSNPHMTPAAVASGNPTDCGGQENSIAGLGQCIVAMTRMYAPNAKIGLHGSGWGTNMDVLENTDPSFDVTGEAQKLGDFLKACGADQGDMVVVDASDRDAGYYQQMGRQTWWDATNATLPNFHQAFAWAKALSDDVGKPVVWWQLPVGNMSGDNSPNHYQDNRVDYFFAHTDELAASGAAGMLFGAGQGDQTTPETDGGNLVSKVQAYEAAGGQAACQ